VASELVASETVASEPVASETVVPEDPDLYAFVEPEPVSGFKEREKPDVHKENSRKLNVVTRKHMSKIEGSWDKVKAAADGLFDNLRNYIQQMRHFHDNGFSLITPFLKQFYYAIPGKAYHKLAVMTLRTYLQQAKDHCGKTILNYNPLNPKLRLRRRDTELAEIRWTEGHPERDDTLVEATWKRVEPEEKEETMTLAKFGDAILVFLDEMSIAIMDYLDQAVPLACNTNIEWLTLMSEQVEKMDPDDFKYKILTLLESS